MANPLLRGSLGNPFGVQIFWDLNATEFDGFNFPLSKHRSRRLHKKLLNRHGVQERRKPAIFKSGGRFIVHPALRLEIERMLKP